MTPPSVVFLDRDGTIIHDAHYLAHPEQVHLLDGSAEAIARLNRAKIPVILITNQSGIGRGYLTIADYERVHARMVELLGQHDAHLDATYYCPHDPDNVPSCSCRKPSPLLFQQAIREHQLDPSRAVSLGDRWRDVAPAIALGGIGILIPSPDTPPADIVRAEREASIFPSLSVAVSQLLQTA
jgi:D-glycero-D-manno-heptose 1,7-bisphosphate phosphatase